MLSTMFRKAVALAVCSLAIGMLFVVVVHAATSGIVKRVYTDKARYNTGNTVTVSAELTNDTGSSYSNNITITIYQGETQKYTTSTAVTLANGSSTTVNFTWTPPSTNHIGY